MCRIVRNQIFIAPSFIVVVLLSAVSTALATTPKSIFDVLSYPEVLEIDLSFDLESAIEERREEKDYPAALSFLDEQGNRQEWPLNISLRGKFRRVHCKEMPPLRLDFSKKDLKKAGLAEFDDLKLVNYCMEDDRAAREALVKEFLTYKLFNQLTEVSFRVQMVKINFKDINTGKTKKQLGFLIEDAAQLRARIGAEKINSLRVTEKEQFHPYYLKVTALFQYMIGNKDWGLTFAKNVKYIRKEDKVIPVPYDFDFAGIVGAPYTTARENVEQSMIYGRAYKGFREEMEMLQPVIDEFLAKREALIDTIRNCSFLKSSSKKEMIAFLEFFFKNPQDITFGEVQI